MAAKFLLGVAMVAAALVGTSMGASYTVGAPGGSWDLRTNYAQWASGVTLRAGDQLVFSYSPTAHDVVEVSKADYDACSASSPVATFRTGNDVVPLPAAGSRYFICGFPGHCAAGMKVQINVEAAPARSAPSPVNTPSPAARGPAPSAAPPNASAPTAGSQEKPPSSSAASAGVGSAAGLCFSVVVAAAALMLFY